MRLVLFDIDQTLIETGGVGMRCMGEAVRVTLGEGFERIGRIVPDGKTDPQILLEALADERHVKAVTDCYVGLLQAELSRPDARRRLKPGVASLLAALRAHASTALGLLTGNLQTTAYLKLAALDIADYFPVGGFGSDAADRNRLGPVAVERARSHYGAAFDRVWVIGDTPLDVRAAHATPARALGVATGRHSVAELLAAGADAALTDLSDTDRVLDVLDGRL